MAELVRDHFDASKWGVRLDLAFAGPVVVQFGKSDESTIIQINRETWVEMGCPESIIVSIKREPVV